jgi:hypothetical protein
MEARRGNAGIGTTKDTKYTKRKRTEERFEESVQPSCSSAPPFVFFVSFVVLLFFSVSPW